MASNYICICDRCGNEIPIRAHKILKFRCKSKFILKHDRYNELLTMELCETCKKSFENWVNRKPYNDFVEERENNG